MSEKINLNDDLSIYVVTDSMDFLLTQSFYENMYNNVFFDENNNTIAGLLGMNSVYDVKTQIQTWLSGNSEYMFFLYKDNNIVGTTQAFKSKMFEHHTLSLGYIVSPSSQGKGYGTMMLKFVSEYLTSKNINIVLGFRDGNVASERIAAKNNYSYLLRTTVPDASGEVRPMTFYKYNGKPVMNESYNVIPNSKILTTKQQVEIGSRILSRVNPKMLSFNEYVYLTSSSNKPTSLNETYFIFSSPHYRLKDKLKVKKLNPFAMTDEASKKMFNPSVKGDISLDKFYNLVESNLNILGINDDKTSMILGNDVGEIKIKVLNNIMLIEDFTIIQ